MLTGQPNVSAAAVAVWVALPVAQPALPAAAVAVGGAQPVAQPLPRGFEHAACARSS